MVLREGPMIKEETLDVSGDSELENEALEAEKRRKSLESKYEASLQEQIRMQMKVTKQSIPGPDRGDETIQRKGRDTRNSNKLMDVNPNNIDLLVATTKKVLQNYEVEAERNTEMDRLLTKLDSVGNTHQNCSRWKDGLAPTNNIEASGIPKEKYQTILVNKEA